MKYRNRRTGLIVEPSCDVAVQAFARSPNWEEVGASKPLVKMTTPELDAKAAELGVDIAAAKTKADKIALIKAALASGT